MLGLEAFANMFSAEFDSEARASLEKWLPKSHALFTKMLKELAEE